MNADLRESIRQHEAECDRLFDCPVCDAIQKVFETERAEKIAVSATVHDGSLAKLDLDQPIENSAGDRP